MNLRALEYLVAVAQFKHFGKAAKFCNISQPALSMQLKKLEDELGVTLFERNNKQVMITKIGVKIVMRARMILQQAADMKQFAKAAGDIFTGELKLGAFPTIAPYYLPQIVPKIIDALPNIDLLLVEEKTENLIESLKKGDLDCAFIALPIEAQNLNYEFVFEDIFYLAVSNTHYLADLVHIDQAQLEGLQLLLLEEGHCMRQNALDICQLSGAKENHGFRATSLETLRQMVAINSGITLMPAIARQQNDGLTYIKFKQNPPARHIALVWRKTSEKIELFERIISLCIR